MTNQGPAAAHCGSRGGRTATPPDCEDCRADEIANLTAIVADGQELSAGQGAWLLAEVGRLRAALTERGEQLDRLAGQVQRAKGILAPGVAQCGGCKDSAFRHRRECDAARVLDGGQS